MDEIMNMWLIISYLTIGFIFTRIYHFVALKQYSQNGVYVIFQSLISGFIIIEFAKFIFMDVTTFVELIIVLIISMLTAYILGTFVSSRRMVKILDFLKIRSTTNEYLWDDLMDMDYPMKVIVKYDNLEYCGMVHLYENYSSIPHVVLASYIVNTHGKISDYTKGTTRIIILDISTAKSVEIIYAKNSDMCKDIETIATYNTEREK